MDDSNFWQLIEASRQDGQVHLKLVTMLRKLPAQDIIAFKNTFRRKLAAACVFPVLMACFIIESYVSDDVFENFCAWLISQGRQRFESALCDPDSIADWLGRDDAWTKNMTSTRLDDIGEQMLLVAEKAYRRYGDEDMFSQLTEVVSQPDFKQPWPKSKVGYQKRLPKLFKKFWNQDRIKRLHRYK